MIYLDNAATTFPKPRSVYSEVLRCIRTYCGNPGRGSHKLSTVSEQKVFECRCEISDLIGASSPENIFFCENTTMAINSVIKGLLTEGDHVLISDLEHNSVFRPIFKMAKQGKITYDIFPSMCLDDRRFPSGICAGIARLIKPNTKLIICTHASNICSAVLPIPEIGAFCRRHKILFAVDAAQSVGHIPIDMKKMNIDILCAPGHKGLYGIQGCGFVALRDGIMLDTLTEGGNGINSLERNMPDFSPERYESGTLPVPSIVGLLNGIRAVKKIGVCEIHDRETQLCNRLCEMLGNTHGVEIYAPQHKGSVLLFNVTGVPSNRTGDILNRNDICVRTGFHCSALGHATLKTPDDGAVRVGFGMFNTQKEIEQLWRTVKKITP